MTRIAFDQFGGIAPLYDPRKLSPRMAANALDVRMEGGDLRPLNAPVEQAALGFTVSALYRYAFLNASTWLAWPDPLNVDVVKSPIPDDAFGRIYWSCNGTSNNYPRIASQPTQGDISSDAGSVRRLGVPAPDVAPSTTEQYAATSVVPMAMSQTSPVVVTVQGKQPYEDGQRVLVQIYKDNPPAGATGNMIEINGKEFVVSNCTATTFELRQSDGTNYSAFTNASDAMISRVYADSDMENRSYVYTFVTDFGEEGPPSPPSPPSDFRYDSSVKLSANFTVPAGFKGINRVRVYRIVAGSGVAQPYFTKELGVSVSGQAGSFTIVDDTAAVSLGESLPSTDWMPPPLGLDGFTRLPCGSIAAFKGNTLYFSEPYLPHAWPAQYRRTVNFDIVGIAVVGQTLVIGTKGKPSVALGSGPDSMSVQELDVYAPALAKRGMCNIGSGVLYASTEGIVLVTASGAQVLTSSLFSKQAWMAAWSPTMAAVFNDHHAILFSSDPAKPSLLLYLNNGILDVCPLSLRGRAPAFDPSDGTVQFVSGDFRSRFKYDAGAPMPYQWTSRIASARGAANMAGARVLASEYPVTLTVGYAGFANGEASLRPDQTMAFQVAGPEPFRLPAGFQSRDWQITLSGTAPVQAVMLAESMDELA